MADNALSPEEWQEKALSGRGRTEPRLEARIDEEDGEIVLAGAWVHADERHAIAALCLHAQPFGFTPYDVKLLRHYAEQERSHGLSNLATRITALLPRETDV